MRLRRRPFSGRWPAAEGRAAKTEAARGLISQLLAEARELTLLVIHSAAAAEHPPIHG